MASTQNGSSGSPVFLINETKVIGIHKQSNRNENIGDFIYQIFDVLKSDVDKIKGNYKINISEKNNKKIKDIEPNYQIEQINDDLLNGKCKEYYENGKLAFDGEYLNGQINGKCKEYYGNNGKLTFEGEYLNGKKYGKCKEYNVEGKLIFEIEYKIWKTIIWNIIYYYLSLY